MRTGRSNLRKPVLAFIGASLLAAGPVPADDGADSEVVAPRPEAIDRRALTDQMQLESTSIRGNQELPRVLYIVPWKDPALGDISGKPVNSLIDEVLAPLDRDVFLRQTNYFDQLYGSPDAGVSD